MAATHAQSFLDRADAGSQLARALRIYRGQHPLVLGIPRGEGRPGFWKFSQNGQ